MPLSVNVQLVRLLPPLEQAPEKMAERPPDTVSVIDVPVVNEAVCELPVVTLMPAGLDVTLSPLRPLADTVRAAVCAGGGGGAAAVTVTVAVRVTPFNVAVMVAVVSADTLVVFTVKPRAVVPDATVTLDGMLTTAGLLLESETTASVSAAAVSITKAEVGEPPATLDGLAVTLWRLKAGAPAGVTVSVAERLEPLYVAVITTDVDDATAEVETRNPPVKLLAGTVAVAGTLATAGLLLDSEIVVSVAGPDDITMVPLEASPPVTVVGFTSSEPNAAGGGGVWAVKLRAAENGPATPAELTPRTRQKCVPAASPVVA